MSNKEMLHRKQYRIAAVVAGLALAVSMTACGAQKGTEGTESVETMEKRGSCGSRERSSIRGDNRK